LAVDLGASSGRIIAARHEGEQIVFDEVHRFPNGPIERDGTLYWDFDALLRDIVEGLRKGVAAGQKAGCPVRSVGIDSWGVDYGLLGAGGTLLAPPVHYRDGRTEGVMESVFDSLISREEIYRKTGIQFLRFNTIYQLVALKRADPEQLERAEHLLMMADLVYHALTGNIACEFTNATTTQLYDPVADGWSDALIEMLGFPRQVFPRIISPGTRVGKLKPEIAAAVGDDTIEAIAVATHDTGSAVAAVPARTPDFAYLSCGTWSLLGTEVRQPVITDESLACSLTNEGGVENTYRLLRNIMGLWLLQETRAEWKRQGRDVDWDAITNMAGEAEPFRSLLDPDDPSFIPPGDMPDRIRDHCRSIGQPVPETDAALVRCILESLALKYRVVLERIERVVGRKLPALHLVGGGIRNTVLCQFTADACERVVMAGPVEATALGNIGVQLMAAGRVANLTSLRRVIEQSEKPIRYTPADPGPWRSAAARFQDLLVE